MTALRVQGLGADVDGAPFLRSIDFQIPDGELHVILGPSGSGKTTLLKTLAGLQPQTTGHVHVGHVEVTGMPPERRKLVLLHQEDTLFPHLDVANNIGFGPTIRHESTPAVRARVKDLLRLVGLEGFQSRRVQTLSGGEKQRVALARALAVEPRMLLLDEPFSALDRSLRQSLRDDLRRILRERGITALYVTHDQEEAFALGDGLLVMAAGRIIDKGRVADVFRTPRSLEAARVLGRRNLLPFRTDAQGRLATSFGDHVAPAGPLPARGTLLIREEAVRITSGPGSATVESARFLGSRTEYVVERAGARVMVERQGPPAFAPGETVDVAWTSDAIVVYDEAERQTPYP